jgi:hypothetical protein
VGGGPERDDVGGAARQGVVSINAVASVLVSISLCTVDYKKSVLKVSMPQPKTASTMNR